MRAKGPKIIQFGLPYSPNLGDGIISDCVGHGVREILPDADFLAIDLSARSRFGATPVRNRQLALRILRVLPQRVRHIAVARKLGAILDAVEPAWEKKLAGADLVLIGGGQIFSDADLNFPLKIARAAKLASRSGIPTVIYAVGVANNWSARGTALYRSVLGSNLKAVGVRDTPSRAAWTTQMGAHEPAPALMRDPGLLAAACYGAVSPDEHIGLCVSDPKILQYHSEDGQADASFADLALTLLSQGHKLRLFCNGAVEDAAALASIAKALAGPVARGDAEIAPVPSRPKDLAHLVASCRSIVAHRLHACIVAYSYERPVVGLGWDRKVESFFASVGLSDAFSPPGEAVESIAEKLGEISRAGIDAEVHAQVLRETREGLRRALVSVL